MQKPIQITQYALAGFLEDLTEAKTFLSKYAKGSYHNINKYGVEQEEINCVNELFEQVNKGEISFAEANRLYGLYKCSGDNKHNVFKSEKQFEEAVCAYLTQCGISFETQIQCFSGRLDILTKSFLIELKITYSDADLRHAIGQVITYGLENEYRDKRKIVLFPIIPNANKTVYGNDVYAPLIRKDYSDYLEAKYDIFVCDIDRFKWMMSLGEESIDLCTGKGVYRS